MPPRRGAVGGKKKGGSGGRASSSTQPPNPPNALSRKGRKGLSAGAALQLDTDVFDAEDGGSSLRRRALDDEYEDDDDDVAPLQGEDEEIDSDDEDVELPWEAKRRTGGGGGKAKQAAYADDDEASIGSSLEGVEMAELSHMLDDDDDAPPENANDQMLKTLGLANGGRPRRPVERNEGVTEHMNASAQALGADGGALSIEALLNSASNVGGLENLRKEMKKRAANRTSSAHTTLAAPLEGSDQRRLERTAASQAAHRDVSRWDRAVQEASKAESLSFPPERPKSHGLSSNALTSRKPQVKRERERQERQRDRERERKAHSYPFFPCVGPHSSHLSPDVFFGERKERKKRKYSDPILSRVRSRVAWRRYLRRMGWMALTPSPSPRGMRSLSLSDWEPKG